MGKTLTRDVHVVDPDTGQAEWFHPGDTLPDWAEPLVTNEKAFAKLVSPFVPNSAIPVDEDDDEDDYSKMKNDELRALLDDRGLPVSGNHKELVARLRESDAAGG
jgi:hypothetical protein